MAESAYRARSAFAVPGLDGMPRVIREGDIVSGDDPLVGAKSPQRAFFQSMSEYVEQTTQAPGERRQTPIPTRARRGTRNQQETDMPHMLPPEHEDSPASTFAPMQPAAGVVADDVDEKGQNLAGGPKASEFKPSKDEVEKFASPSTGHTGEAGTPDDDKSDDDKPKPAKK